MPRKEFAYRGCRVTPENLPAPITVACNHTNRELNVVWRVTFPDDTWCRTGTKDDAKRYIDRAGRSHGVPPSGESHNA